MTLSRSASNGLIAVTLFALPFAPAHSETYRWTQFVPGGLEARAITDEATCPRADIDGQPMAMQQRAAPAPGFATTVCAVSVPVGAKSIKIGDVSVGAAVAAPRRIAIIGDTGCRLKGSYLQDCNDPVKWPFREVAAAVAAKKPDLVIHVGDYHYRESACPAGVAGCAGSPFGDNWAVWQADFFGPAAGLLAAAPWVMVRGNHEDCERAGKGWSRALDAFPLDTVTGCNATDPIFPVKFGNVALAVVDVALADEPRLDAAKAEAFRAQYASISALTTGPTWILQHRPIWSIGGTVAGFQFGDNKTLAAAAQNVLPAQVQMIVSGHHHIFQVLGYQQDLPVQIVSGHGGDYLNQGRSADPKGWTIGTVSVASGLHKVSQFGFSMLEQQDKGWLITNYDQSGIAQDHCGIIDRVVACVAE